MAAYSSGRITTQELDTKLNEAEKIFILVNQWMLNGLPSLNEVLGPSTAKKDLEEFLNADFWDNEDPEDEDKIGLYIEVDEKIAERAQEIFERANLTIDEVLDALLKNIAENGKLPVAALYEEN